MFSLGTVGLGRVSFGIVTVGMETSASEARYNEAIFHCICRARCALQSQAVAGANQATRVASKRAAGRGCRRSKTTARTPRAASLRSHVMAGPTRKTAERTRRAPVAARAAKEPTHRATALSRVTNDPACDAIDLDTVARRRFRPRSRSSRLPRRWLLAGFSAEGSIRAAATFLAGLSRFGSVASSARGARSLAAAGSTGGFLTECACGGFATAAGLTDGFLVDSGCGAGFARACFGARGFRFRALRAAPRPRQVDRARVMPARPRATVSLNRACPISIETAKSLSKESR